MNPIRSKQASFATPIILLEVEEHKEAAQRMNVDLRSRMEALRAEGERRPRELEETLEVEKRRKLEELQLLSR